MTISKRTRAVVITRDGLICSYCCATIPDRTSVTLDHVIPISKGGPSSPRNLVVACAPCNVEKAATLRLPRRDMRGADRFVPRVDARVDAWGDLVVQIPKQSTLRPVRKNPIQQYGCRKVYELPERLPDDLDLVLF